MRSVRRSAADVDELPRGSTINRRFVIREHLDSGGQGSVYSAADNKLERDVALKLMHPDRIGRLGSRGRRRYAHAFLREARAAARIPHGNVVVVHDVQVVQRLEPGPGGTPYLGVPFLVSELLSAKTLRARLVDGPIDVAQTIAIAVQICEALACAHAAGLVHRDLKPENLTIDEQGRVKVLDFGLAQSIFSAEKSVRRNVLIGSPGYMAPEQLEGVAATPRHDVFAVGVIVYEMLAGDRPFALDTSLARLVAAPKISRFAREAPRALEELVARCLAFDPAERPESGAEVLYELWRIRNALAGAPVLGAPLSNDVCPFPGLRAFEESDTRFFFGRSRRIKECFDLVDTRRRWLAVEGPSGVGKSSLVLAGILPGFRAGWIHGGPSRWRVATMRPGRNALAELRAALIVAFGAESGRKRALIEGESSLVEIAETLLAPGEGLVIAVDQLEELITMTADETIRARTDELLASMLETSQPLYLLTTMRSDFIEEYRRLPRLAALLNTHAARYLLRAMSQAEMHQAILGPAALAGLRFEPGLAERILADAGDEQSALPLVAHLLRALADGSSDGPLSQTRHEEDTHLLREGSLSHAGSEEGSQPHLLREGSLSHAGSEEGSQPHLLREGSLSHAGSEEGSQPHPLREGCLTHARYDELGGLAGALGKSADRALASLSDEDRARARRILLSLVRTRRDGRDTRRAVSREQAFDAAGGGDGADRLLHFLSAGPRLISTSDARVDIAHEALIDDWPTLKGWLDEERRLLERRDDLEAAALAWQGAGRPDGGLARGAQLAYFDSTTSTLAVAHEYLQASKKLAETEEKARFRALRIRVAALSVVAVLLLSLSAWAVIEQRRADQSRRAGVAAADVLMNKINDRLGMVPGTANARADLLEAASDLLDTLGDDDRETLRKQAAGRRARGTLELDGGRERALDNLLASAAITRRIVASDPNDLDARIELARTIVRLRYEAHLANRQAEATKYGFECLQVITPAFERAPDRYDVALAYSMCLRSMSAVGRHSGRVRDALIHAQTAWAVMSDPKGVFERAEAAGELARLYDLLGEHGTAVAYEDLRYSVRASVPTLNADSQTALRNVAWTVMARSEYHLHGGQTARALELAEEAVQIATAVDGAEPEVLLIHRDTLMTAELRLGEVLLAADRPAEARQHFARCLQLVEPLLPSRATDTFRAAFNAYRGLAECALREDDPLAAIDLSLRSIDYGAVFLAPNIDGREVLQRFARLYAVFAAALAQAGFLEESALNADRAIELISVITDRDPDDVLSRSVRSDIRAFLEEEAVR